MKIELLPRPYDYKVLIEVYVNTLRTDFPHKDFSRYYAKLLPKLEKLFGVHLNNRRMTFEQKTMWGLFHHTAQSLLHVRTPWDAYLEYGLTINTVEQQEDDGAAVMNATATLFRCASESAAAHRVMMHALFRYIFGTIDRVITSEELRLAGFDDSREPKYLDYIDYL